MQEEQEKKPIVSSDKTPHLWYYLEKTTYEEDLLWL